jgi:hypothetical protein
LKNIEVKNNKGPKNFDNYSMPGYCFKDFELCIFVEIKINSMSYIISSRINNEILQ